MTSNTEQSPVVSLVVGTAGHIDHGKSSLVEALTGTHPSRLKEEQLRGMTIDIGYAEFPVSAEVRAGIIDVPGHERFIRNMVAGASGIDFVILVIAADDGVMPQTREHLQILRLLGVERGMTVVTKIDAVDAELLELVEEEIHEFLTGTFLEEAPLRLVSNTTRAGIAELAEELRALLLALPGRSAEGVFRMPIQRVFSVKGHGTVVTGVPVSGRVVVGDELEILPAGLPTRVRGLQVHHHPAEEAHAGHRSAINIADVKHKDLQRGDVIAARGFFTAAELLETRLSYLDHHEQPMRNDLAVRFHLGTADVGGRVVLLDKKVLLPGESGLAQIRLDEPVVCAAGDPFVIRLASPLVTLGGGRVLGETRWRFKRFRDWLNENIAQKEAHLDDDEGYLEYVVRSAGKRAAGLDEIALAVKREPAQVRENLRHLVGRGLLRELERGRSFMHRDMFKEALKQVDRCVLALHETEGLVAGFQNSQIVKAAKLDLHVVEDVVAELVQRGKFERLSGGQVRHAGFTGGLSKEDMRLVKAIEEMHVGDFWKAPILSEMATQLDRPAKKLKGLMTWLCQMGRLVQLTPDLCVHIDAVKSAESLLVRRILEGGPMPSVEFKDLIGATRKYVIPLLEYFDKKGITKRDDNDRNLVEHWRKKAFPETLEGLGQDAD
ncbi:MAG: selenocysteine-specific translation elongation factor [Planctomycetes bacterium]|nr:selenocysteine-specific translation elongation factor [Planctomycetota bacterium]